MMIQAPLYIVQCDHADLSLFRDFPYDLYRDHPVWVPPLRMDQKAKYTVKKNPFFKHADVGFWLAYRDKKIVGRIAAFVNHLHLEKYQDQCGHFGCFEGQDEEVAHLLLNTARSWVKQQGMVKMVGPYDFSINEMSGLLIEGFEKRPFLMMPYNPPEYAQWFESFGLKKAKDLYAYMYDTQTPISEKANAWIAMCRRTFPVELCQVNPSKLLDDIKLMFKVFNEAWAHNWGSLPLTDEEISFIAQSMKPIAIPEAGFFACKNNEVVGIFSPIPNINDIIFTYNGRLFPLNAFHFIWQFRLKKLTSFRVCLAGIIPKYVSTKTSSLIFFQLVYHLLEKVKQYPNIRYIELSWILEDNINLLSLMEIFGAYKDKTYRVYDADAL